MEELDNAEQYAIIAGLPGWYPYYNCGTKAEIFLYRGEAWKYGVTTKGKEGHYPMGMPKKSLIFKIQFRGNIHECLKQEKIKLVYYPLIPENQKRSNKIIRPPGNKIER